MNLGDSIDVLSLSPSWILTFILPISYSSCEGCISNESSLFPSLDIPENHNDVIVSEAASLSLTWEILKTSRPVMDD